MCPPGSTRVSPGNSSRTRITTGGWRSGVCSASAPSCAIAKTAAAATRSSAINAGRTRGTLASAEQAQPPRGADLENLDRVAPALERTLGHHEGEVLGRVAGQVEGGPDRLDAAVDGHREVTRGVPGAAAQVARDLGRHHPARRLHVREQGRLHDRGPAVDGPGDAADLAADQVAVRPDARVERGDVPGAELAQ